MERVNYFCFALYVPKNTKDICKDIVVVQAEGDQVVGIHMQELTTSQRPDINSTEFDETNKTCIFNILIIIRTLLIYYYNIVSSSQAHTKEHFKQFISILTMTSNISLFRGRSILNFLFVFKYLNHRNCCLCLMLSVFEFFLPLHSCSFNYYR